MLRCRNAENVGGSTKNPSSRGPVSRTVLRQTSRHNCQSKGLPSACKKSSRNGVHSSTSAANTESEGSRRLSDRFKGGCSRHVEPSRAEWNTNISASARIKILEEEASAKTSEIQELKQCLQETKLQLAEVVAQSAIIVRDVQCAASKEVAEALYQVQLLHKLEGKGNQFTALGNQFTAAPSDSCSISKFETRDVHFPHKETTAAEIDMAQTYKDLLDCRFRLSHLENQFQWMSDEKEKLEFNLMSSVQTALKLQNIVAHQKILMKLERLAIEERARNETALSVQSARKHSELIQKRLNDLLFSKAEAEGLVKTCIQLLCYAQKELCTMRALEEQQAQRFEVLEQQNLQQLALAEEQKEYFDELQVGTFVKCIVLESILEGAMKSLLTRGSLEFIDDYGSALPVQNGCKGGCIVTTSERFGFLKKEAALRENLIQSEYEVEILGDKVDEQRVILEKVASLLDFISKSALTSHNTKGLIGSIIEQLQKLEGDYPKKHFAAVN